MTPLPPPPPQRPRPSSKMRAVAYVVVVAVVAWVAGLTGALVGNGIADWFDSPPKRASTEPLDVAGPRDRIEARLDVAAVVERVAPSVVTISADFPGGRSTGTGVIVTSDGEILTNSHVVHEASAIRVRLAGETEPREVTLLADDPGNDLALLRMRGDDFAAATFADPATVRLGDEVVAIGFALGLDGDPSVTLGIVSALDRTISNEDVYLDNLIQTDASISSGNSGGPLVNAAGEVVGINTAVARGTATTAATNVGFAISVGEVLRVIESLRAQAGGAERIEGYLGVVIEDRIDGGQGAVVRDIQVGTPAADAGMEVGDLVVAVGDVTIDGATGLIASIRDLTPGEQVSVTVVRDGHPVELVITLTARPDD